MPCWARVPEGVDHPFLCPSGPLPCPPSTLTACPLRSPERDAWADTLHREESMQSPEGTSREDACQRGHHPQTNRGSFGAGGTGSSPGQGPAASPLTSGQASTHSLTSPGGTGAQGGVPGLRTDRAGAWKEQGDRDKRECREGTGDQPQVGAYDDYGSLGRTSFCPPTGFQGGDE